MIDLTAPKVKTYSPSQSLLVSGLSPAFADITDEVPYEMGVELTFAVAGYIQAIRYYKAPSETGSHVGRIWNASGTLLTSVNFTDETASGWQEQALPNPFPVTASKYVISVNVNSHFAITSGGFSSTFTNGDLSAIADGANGAYNTTLGAFPTSGANSNYFRDVVFTRG
jgi:hypothetical protein